MELEELKRKSNTKILLRGKSGRGKTMTAATVALRVAEEGGRVLYVDTEAEGSSTLVALVESDDTQFTEDTVSDIEYVQAEDYSSLYDYVDNDGQYHDKFDLIVVDTLDHKHSYVLKGVTDAKHEGDADWNEYARIYGEEKNFMEQLAKPKTNILATLDPESGSMDKPKGAQTNIHGYFTIVVDLVKNGDGWSHKIRNWVNRSDLIDKKVPSLEDAVVQEVTERL